MSRKSGIPASKIITAGDMSLANITSKVVDIRFQDNVAIQLNFTGTPSGTFAVQGSVDHMVQDPNESVINAGNWIPLTLNPAPVASGAAGQILLDLNQLSFPFIRVVYTRVGSSGTLDAYVSSKQV